jgi:hypothetical protein
LKTLPATAPPREGPENQELGDPAHKNVKHGDSFPEDPKRKDPTQEDPKRKYPAQEDPKRKDPAQEDLELEILIENCPKFRKLAGRLMEFITKLEDKGEISEITDESLKNLELTNLEFRDLYKKVEEERGKCKKKLEINERSKVGLGMVENDLNEFGEYGA